MVSDERMIRVLRLLQGAIRAAGFTQTRMDDRIGRRRGYLSHVFQRRVDLKLQDLLSTLEVLQIDPASFFRTALRSLTRPQLDDLIELVTTNKTQQAGGTRPAPAPERPEGRGREEGTPAVGEAVDPDQELLDRVRAIVRQVLSSLPRGDRQKLG